MSHLEATRPADAASPTSDALPKGVGVHGPIAPAHEEILSPEALAFVADLHRLFEPKRQALLAARAERQAGFDAGGLPGFLPETEDIRDSDWTVAPIPPPLQDRRVEITGPVDRKMMIGALNSGAKVFMADYEDSHSPTWNNCIQGQINVRDAVRGTIRYEHPKKGTYRLDAETALLVVRVRGLHLPEAHVTVDGEPVSGALFDFALDFWHNAHARIAAGEGPYYYLPKLEHHDEAAWWNDIFVYAQNRLGVPVGTIKTTVLIETLPAVFQMDEILHALQDHIVGLNAGRWDYIFSCIKTLRNHPDKVLPDRAQVTMTVPHMRAYTELLVKTCHKRGAFAMGGMSAFIPARDDPAVTEKALGAVREDKRREVQDGCDGTWVAHPDLVPVALKIFEEGLDGRPNQVEKQRDDVLVTQDDLLRFHIPDGTITQDGIRNNLRVALQYLATWLGGNGAVAIEHLMEDAATAEISRSQLWQWIHNDVQTAEGQQVTKDLVEASLDEATSTLRVGWSARDADADALERIDTADDLVRQVALAERFPDFLTLPAYRHLVGHDAHPIEPRHPGDGRVTGRARATHRGAAQ